MKWLHDILKGASLTGALFVFQACYGSPQIEYREGGAPMRFSLVSARTGEPLEGIGIAAKPLKEGIYQLIGTTGADGKCEVFIPFVRDLGEGPYLQFTDANGVYAAKDTTLADLRQRDIVIKLNRNL